MRRSSRSHAGFLRARLFQNIFLITSIFVLTHFGIKFAKEYYKIQKCETCTARMRSIETAKKQFKAIYSSTIPDGWNDLLPFLPNKSIPECPWGGKYEHALDLKKQVTCSLNGNPEYEPSTPGIPLTQNGYMDLATPPKALSLRDLLRLPPASPTPKKENAEDLRKHLFSPVPKVPNNPIP
jgi:hypothetical protein